MPIFIAITQSTSMGIVFDSSSETRSVNLLLKMLQNKGAKIIDVKLKTYKKKMDIRSSIHDNI